MYAIIISFGTALKTGSSRRFHQCPTTHVCVPSPEGVQLVFVDLAWLLVMVVLGLFGLFGGYFWSFLVVFCSLLLIYFWLFDNQRINRQILIGESLGINDKIDLSTPDRGVDWWNTWCIWMSLSSSYWFDEGGWRRGKAKTTLPKNDETQGPSSVTSSPMSM